MRIGEALALWLEDLEIDTRNIHIRVASNYPIMQKLKQYVVDNNIKLRSYCMKSRYTRYETFLISYIDFIAIIMLQEMNIKKDIRDVRNIDKIK